MCISLKFDDYRFACRALLAFKSVGVSSDASTFCSPRASTPERSKKMKDLNAGKYIVIKGRKVEVSYELDKWYRNTKDALRKRQHEHGECTCPRKKWNKCTTDCVTCPFRTTTNISLDGIYSNEGDSYGDEYLFQETKTDYISFEDTFANREECKEILKRVYDLMPELIEVGNLRLLGYTNSKVAEMLGTKRTTLDSRIAKIYNIIKKEFPDARF